MQQNDSLVGGQAAEANFWHDALAADLVCRSALPLKVGCRGLQLHSLWIIPAAAVS